MARIKYTYDTQTCRYERVKRSWMDVTLNMGGYFSAALLVAVAIVLIRNSYFDSPVAKQLKQENDALTEHHATLLGELGEIKNVISALTERNDNIYRKIYEVEPLAEREDRSVNDFSENYRKILQRGWNNEEYVESTKKRIDNIRQHTSQRSMQEVIRLARENSKMLTSLPAIQPVTNDDLTKLASGFGMRINPYHKARVMHFGIDFATHRGDAVHSTGDGVVKTVKTNNNLETGYGTYIEIDHGYGYITRYAHLGEIKINRGARVKRGDVIGLAGNSGGSIAPHVHYEVLKDGEQIDPLNFMIQGLDDHEFRKLRQMATRENQSFD